MTYVKEIIASDKNYKITKYTNSEKQKKCVITFGEIDSDLEEEGFGKKFIMSLGFDYIYVAKKRYTQYQFLSAEQLENLVKDSISGQEVYTHGSSLGGYCAIYYGGILNANVLAMSPRVPPHPVIDELMGKRFKHKGFHHKEIHELKKTNKRVGVFYDRNNYIDNYFISTFVKPVYPNGEYHHIENAGHYTARALLLSGELKAVVTDFFYDKKVQFTLNKEEIIDWHLTSAKKRVKKSKLPSAQENLEVLLASDRALDDDVRDVVAKYNQKIIQLSKKVRDGYDRKPVKPLLLTKKILDKELYQLLLDSSSVCFVGDSLTEGTWNKGYGWFEPIIENFRSLKVDKFTKENGTSSYFSKNAKKIAKFKSDLFVLAIGRDDIIKNSKSKNNSRNPKEFIENISEIVETVKEKKPSSTFVCIAPWSIEYSSESKIDEEQVNGDLLKEYSRELKRYTESHDFLYIDPTQLLDGKLNDKHLAKLDNESNVKEVFKVLNIYSSAVMDSSPSINKSRIKGFLSKMQD